MKARFEELDWQRTPLGEISLRRRYDPAAAAEVYEVRLGDEYLMSSLFTVAEKALATLALDTVDRDPVRVLVGGLGLGYTAHTALADARVADLTVVEAAEPVLGWHRRELLPETRGLAGDPRCRLVHDDFFRLVRDEPESRYDAILLDIDHTPRHVLHPSHAAFYTVQGVRQLSRHLTDGGVFALWSDDPPDAAFEDALGQVFATTWAHVVAFANPVTGGESSNTVYVATGSTGSSPPQEA
ncbi:spermidine synthase [Promicromonospora iranensis]|uniref:Spermidine synthase n=1 Tax=Promicromonospora iranensis TaxID=1105144 RepID=A0ABU2CRP4_9MICO|nr:spermidine synthase [Promicromonospora iranensis]MDR7384010.1 spermidine synthase [Promicromonospora iranensis]